MYLLKTNELARQFEATGGFNIFAKLLDDSSTKDGFGQCSLDH
jgi:hypothetical protein